jgi:hypothetical protein
MDGLQMSQTKHYPHSTVELRAELASLRARYDSGAVSPTVYSVIREIETELAWAEHDQVRP